MDRKIKLKSLNPYITCNICKGYLIDATAITECLHTFCKSCLIKHLEANTNCPTCDMVIHHSYPRQYINFDRTMQDIVYKLVPGLQESEIEREQQFYRQRGLPCPKEMLIGEETKEKSPEPDDGNQEELINLCLECAFTNQIKQVFVRVPTRTTVLYLKKFIARKIFKIEDLHSVVVFCNCEEVDERDTMKYIYLSKWKFDDVPLVLKCQQKIKT
ncbi:polycomb group RING finger protein 3 [Tribolium castaneum]|uniref:Polycomb group protein Psc-like Protein n=1 Tax=Tribolium castaneum TaxID=7070 RepID=D6WV47_TRICA|nr:PREDICTED: polycomb group RING finger protein 3 [Tribolium castaneum]EFA07780.1 Polycomb group protein Psc-like Protein [Tribolium castaneum]|eukprot:XP_974409.1 PREDICTED: polycomb group RING finger protein 3 [Tribolium castaneum]